MKSVNFEFLRPHWQELADLAGFAEYYAHGDAVSAVVKLRTYGEQIAQRIHEQLRLAKLVRPNFNDLLDDASFRAAVPSVVVGKLHALRIHGNQAAHGEKVSAKSALWLLKEAFDLGCWLFLTFAGGTVEACPAYVAPPAGNADADSKSRLKREKKAVLEQLAAQEAQMQKLLDDLAAARQEATAAKATEEELRDRLRAAQTSANALDFNEEETRRLLIDTQLTSAGWSVSPGVQSTASVGKEVPVSDQPTDSGVGYADYVLYDEGSGKPLAVVEAKKTAVDPEAGRTQAKCYADGLEKEHGQRPVIFYTNGFDIWMWDDAGHCTPRKLYGFYSKDSLQYLIRQRRQRQELTQVIPNKDIAGRFYQIRAVTEVLERFQSRRRKSLIVQATGTGKTRVAIAICEALIRAGWAKRILFLCDRRELRKQAHNAFKAFLPDEPRVYVTTQTYKEREHRIYLATYPAMMKCFETFDVGFFDLIIADESHRSIYNRYRDLFQYFDALEVGLTATPRKDLVSHNTYRLFDCEDNDPTAFYSYDEAINDVPPWLSPFEVHTYTTPFLREGVKYKQMTPEQRRQLEEDEIEPEAIEYEQRQVDKHVFNKDTNRRILRNLMERGIKVAGGSRLGKSIVFARNHNHAVVLQNLFDEMYPQYGGNFCRVIDNYDPRADELIDDLKGEGKNPELTIGISVDMLDTGIDIPEVVNLVFAKPVYSYIKFWQMIGRGTRLCKDLFGPGQHKKKFLIFDHWGNFERFDEHYTEAEASGNGKSIQQVLFEQRVRLAEAAVEAQDHKAFDLACNLLLQDVRDLPDAAIAIREKWREVKTVQQDGAIKRFDAGTKNMLMTTIAPLMQWRNITGHLPAHECDLICCRLQTALVKGSSKADDLRDELVGRVSELQINLNPVKEKVAAMDRVKSGAFWTAPTVESIEEARRDLRGIMKYRGRTTGGAALPPKVLDVTEDESLVQRKHYRPKLAGLELIEYRSRVQSVLTRLIDTTPPLQKIKAGQPVTKEELDKITAIVLAQEPDLDLTDLLEYYPGTAGNLAVAIRSIIGLNAEMVNDRFTSFAQEHKLNSTQLRFLDLLKNHIRDFGAIELDQLYETPFTTLDKDGLDGVFPDERQAEEIIALVESFSRSPQDAGP